MTIRLESLLGAACALGLALPAGGITISTEADYDRWMYPFNATPGTRSTMSTFGAVGSPPFDDRDGQAHVGFDTATAGVPSLLPKNNYQINSVKVSVTHSTTGGALVYDDTYDSYQTYNGTLADTDAGRPIELHGLGFRNGFGELEIGFGPPNTPPGFKETDAFAFADPTLEDVRNVFAMSSSGLEVSNNVSDGFESDPWAVGQAVGLLPGDTVVEAVPGTSPGTTFEFLVNLSDPLIVEYLQTGLQDGLLGFAITSLHAAAQPPNPTTSPNFYTTDSFNPEAVAPSLMLDVTIVPEPGTAGLLCLGLAGMACGGRRRRV